MKHLHSGVDPETYVFADWLLFSFVRAKFGFKTQDITPRTSRSIHRVALRERLCFLRAETHRTVSECVHFCRFVIRAYEVDHAMTPRIHRVVRKVVLLLSAILKDSCSCEVRERK